MTSTDVTAADRRVHERQGLGDIPTVTAEQQWSQVCESGTLHVLGQNDRSDGLFFASREEGMKAMKRRTMCH